MLIGFRVSASIGAPNWGPLAGLQTPQLALSWGLELRWPLSHAALYKLFISSPGIKKFPRGLDSQSQDQHPEEALGNAGPSSSPLAKAEPLDSQNVSVEPAEL
ncbi:hypothetical protein AURDEDRAFT_173905 [Auricularia subglabra TFB-10046 SS5]|nr:hypothetical protein AURDEDRAFT_173905 [Auricularia subglabra TFB-10046 SS5]